MTFDLETLMVTNGVIGILASLPLVMFGKPLISDASYPRIDLWGWGQISFSSAVVIVAAKNSLSPNSNDIFMLSSTLSIVGAALKIYSLHSDSKRLQQGLTVVTLVAVALALTFHTFENFVGRVLTALVFVTGASVITAFFAYNNTQLSATQRIILALSQIVFAIAVVAYFFITLRGSTIAPVGSLISVLHFWFGLLASLIAIVTLLWIRISHADSALVASKNTVQDLHALQNDLNLALAEKQEAIGLMTRLQSSKKVELYAANMMHEINQPLSVLALEKDTIQKVTQKIAEPSDKPALKNVISAISQLEQTVMGIRKLQRHNDIEFRKVNFVTAISEAISLVVQLTGVPRNAFDVCYYDKEQVINTDESLLNHVIFNLLFNSAEAIQLKNEEGLITIRVSSHLEMTSLCVEDNGPGFSANSFSDDNGYVIPFATTKKAGTGIGLQVVQTAIKLLGGKIEYESSSLGGARVTVFLPNEKSGLDRS